MRTQEPYVRTLDTTPDSRVLGPDTHPWALGPDAEPKSLEPGGAARPKRLGFDLSFYSF